MREVLFRGKRVNNGEWIEGYYACKETIDGHYIITETPCSEQFGLWSYFTDNKVDPATVGQYIGLKDKNGQRIFEGDILRFQHPYRGRNGIFEVFFEGCAFNCKDFYMTHFDCPSEAFSEGTEYFEIVGNVHDTPE